MRAGRAGLLAAAGWLLPCPDVRASEIAPVTIVDQLAPGQVNEVIAVWSGGRLLGTLHVDAGRHTDSFQVDLPAGPFQYTLCGMLQRRTEDGRIVNHAVDNAGRVQVWPGAMLTATNQAEQTFTLEGSGAKSEVGDAPACDPTIS